MTRMIINNRDGFFNTYGSREVYYGYMGTIILVIAAVVVFCIGIVSPHKAGKIQRKTDKQAAWLKRWADWLWDPIALWTKKSIEFTRKSLNKIADWGKKANKKTPPK